MTWKNLIKFKFNLAKVKNSLRLSHLYQLSIPYHFQLELSISCALFSKPKEVTSSIVEKSNRLNDFRFFFTKWLTGFCLIPKITVKKKSWCNDQFSISTEFNFKSHDMQLGRFLLKFVYSEKAKNFCKISTVDLTITT